MKVVVLFLCCWWLPCATSLRIQAQTPETNVAAAAVTSPASEDDDEAQAASDYLIGPGDTLDVIVARRPELNWHGQVKEDGNIYSLPYLDDAIEVRCRTERQVALALEAAYARLLRDPKIIVRVVERLSRPAIIFGAIRTPQRVRMGRPVHLNELLAVSGGITDRASGDIQIFRTEPLVCVEKDDEDEQAEASVATQNPLTIVRLLDLIGGKPEANPVIHPGDIVTVIVAEPVYVTGGVVSPQSLNFRRNLTLTRALDMTGGLSKSARGGEIRVYRRQSGALMQDVIKADYDAIKKGKQPDVPLNAYDIIEVPRSGRASARRSWQAAQEMVADEKQFEALPLRVIE